MRNELEAIKAYNTLVSIRQKVKCTSDCRGCAFESENRVKLCIMSDICLVVDRLERKVGDEQN